MLVEIRPLPEKKWHGKKGKESFAQTKTIQALYDVDTSKYATGLTPEEAAHYGKILGVDLSDTFNPLEPHSFWDSKPGEIKLENRTMILDTSKPMDFVKVRVMKASKYVANSMKDAEDNKFPDASHVIFDEEEEVSLKASKVQKRRQAILIASKMSKEDKISMIQLLSDKSFRGKSDDFIDVEIDEVINEKVDDFLKYANMGREEVSVRARVLELIMRNILTKEGGSIYYMGELIGMDYEAAVEWFKNPQNSRIKVSILEKLNK